MKSKLLTFVFSLLLIGIGYLVLQGIALLRFSATPLAVTQTPVSYVFKPGTSVIKLADDLHNLGLLQQPQQLVWLARIKQMTKRLQAGEYEFKAGITPSQLLTQLAQGRVIRYRVTFIEGWTIDQVLQALLQQPIKHQITQRADVDQLIFELSGNIENPEGLFFPDTYEVRAGDSDVNLLRMAYAKLQMTLQSEWEQRQPGLPFATAYEALIAASLIEKETAIASERAVIAGVLVNRLNRQMPLQFDPTVIYGLGKQYNGRLTKQDLATASPYNTYLHRGLPPTPIALVSRDSIHAALHPVMHDYLYFVARGDGTHVFSASLAEHNMAVMAYRKQRLKLESQ